MLKTLKWVYKLGVNHERTRIASHLQVKMSHITDSRDTIHDMLRENADRKRPSKTTAERLMFKLAVEDRVQSLVSEMFEDSNGHWVSGTSLMFPDDQEKK